MFFNNCTWIRKTQTLLLLQLEMNESTEHFLLIANRIFKYQVDRLLDIYQESVNRTDWRYSVPTTFARVDFSKALNTLSKQVLIYCVKLSLLKLIGLRDKKLQLFCSTFS